MPYRTNALLKKENKKPNFFQKLLAHFQWTDWEVRCERHPVTIAAYRDEDYNDWFCHMFLTRTNGWETEFYHVVSDYGYSWYHKDTRDRIFIPEAFLGISLPDTWKKHLNNGMLIQFGFKDIHPRDIGKSYYDHYLP